MEAGVASQHLGCFPSLGWIGLLGISHRAMGSPEKIQIALCPSVMWGNHPWPLLNLWGSLGDQAGSRVEGDL